ncbi:MAG: hypothetical protein QF442_02265 [Candidatus Peribacteraceae bacterium]|nr:hypothetical protein [Candidatus Peribacteraceae bacterium]
MVDHLKQLADAELIQACFMVVSFGPEGSVHTLRETNGDDAGWLFGAALFLRLFAELRDHRVDSAVFFDALEGAPHTDIGKGHVNDAFDTENLSEEGHPIRALPEQLCRNLHHLLFRRKLIGFFSRSRGDEGLPMRLLSLSEIGVCNARD